MNTSVAGREGFRECPIALHLSNFGHSTTGLE